LALNEGLCLFLIWLMSYSFSFALIIGAGLSLNQLSKFQGPSHFTVCGRLDIWCDHDRRYKEGYREGGI